MKFNNKVALITGASVGIGRATAILMAEEGASLVLVDIDGEGLEALKEELAQYTDKVLCFACDVSDEAGVNALVKESLSKFGRIDILVNNAALWRSKTTFLETETDAWKRFMDVNVMGTVYFTKAVLPSMLENSWGRVINVASVTGVYGKARMVHYSTTKGAVIAFSKALAKEVADKGVLINSVSPGSVSPSSNHDIDYVNESDLCFMGRTGSDRENAELICFLASDSASYITGQNIQIDGCRKTL